MTSNLIIQSIASGIVATAALDLWQQVLRLTLGIPASNMGFIGRWFIHLPRGRFIHHDGIHQAPAYPNETAIGWIGHYAVGIVYGFVYVPLIVLGLGTTPTLLNGLVFGAASAVIPWFVMMPSIGGGILGRRTDSPAKACTLAFLAHTAFGFGLFLGAALVPAGT